MGQNKRVFKTDRIKEMEGRQELITAIKEEYKVGLSRLLAYVFQLCL